MKNLLLFDVDGTLIKKGGEFPVTSMDAIKKLAENDDNILVISTGRTTCKMGNLLQGLQKHFQYKVLANGQVLKNNGEYVGLKKFKPETIKEVYEYFIQNNIAAGFAGLDDEVINVDNEVARFMYEKDNLDVPRVCDKYHLENDIYQLCIGATKEQCDFLNDKFPDIKCIPFTETLADVMVSDVSKVNGIKEVVKLLEGEELKIYAFGDGNNDIEMLKFADFGVAMGNANDMVKEAADYVTDHIDNDGLMKALEYLKLI